MTRYSEDVGLRLGEAIRAQRHLLGLTLVDVATRAGLSHPFLSQLERGLARPSMRSLTAIASTLGTSAQALMAAAELPAVPAAAHRRWPRRSCPVGNLWSTPTSRVPQILLRGSTSRGLGALRVFLFWRRRDARPRFFRPPPAAPPLRPPPHRPRAPRAAGLR